MRVHTGAKDDHVARLQARARDFPLLSAEEERQLAIQWRDGGDRAALTRLVGAHLRLVMAIARQNRFYGMERAELVAEGNAGLMQALQHYDPDRGARVATYAAWWIRAAIQEYVMRNWSAVRLGKTRAQKKLFFNLRRAKRAIGASKEGELSPATAGALAARLGVSQAEVMEMNHRLAAKDESLDVPFGEGGELPRLDSLRDERPDPEALAGNAEEHRIRRALLGRAMEQLTPRERHIVIERKLGERARTLNELSAAHGISRERVRQIETAAIKKLAKAVRAAGAARRPPQPRELMLSA